MKIAFYGGQTAGIITLLTLVLTKHKVVFVIPEDKNIDQITKTLKLTTKNKLYLNSSAFVDQLEEKVDLLICCHGRKILSKELVTRIKCINLHPCLYKYKGAKPIDRLIAEGNQKASVASHWMVEKVDAGKTIFEDFIIIPEVSKKSPQEVYNLLYPIYVQVLLKTLIKVNKEF